MNNAIRESFSILESTDDKVRYSAFQTFLSLTDEKVDWVYDIWDGLLEKLKSDNSYQRSIAIMLFCNLAKSDHENRMAGVLNDLLAHTRDEKFITSRQCIQNIWKIAAVNRQYRNIILDHLEKRFRECREESHYNLIRMDILQSIMSLFSVEKDDQLLIKVRELITLEEDPKYRKGYSKLLKG
jgi:hypothetical protein